MAGKILRLQELRELRGMEIAETAAQIGVSRRELANWENEAYLPLTRQLPQIAYVFGVNIDELYSVEGRNFNAGTYDHC